MRIQASIALMWTCAGLAAGCGEQAPATYNLVLVEGTVTENGKPVPNARVVFVPSDDDRLQASGVTDSDGRYLLRHNSKAPGVETGTYVVKVQRLDHVRRGRRPASSTPGDAKSQPLTANVQPAATTFDFDIAEAPSE